MSKALVKSHLNDLYSPGTQQRFYTQALVRPGPRYALGVSPWLPG